MSTSTTTTTTAATHPREHPTTLRKLLASPSLTRPKGWWRSQCLLYDLPAPATGTIKAFRAALETALTRPGGLDGVVRPVVKPRDPLKGVVGAKVARKTKAAPAERRKGAAADAKTAVAAVAKPARARRVVTRSMGAGGASREKEQGGVGAQDREGGMDFEMEYDTEYREQFRKLNAEGRVDEPVRRRRETLFYGVQGE